MGQHGSLSTELGLRTDDLKHLVRPQYVKGLTRSDVGYARPMFGSEPLHGQEILAIVRRFRHHINGSGSFLSGKWEALTYDLAAIYGTIGSTAPFQFEGVSAHLFDRFMDSSSQGSNDETRHLFVLGPGELVRGVDLSWHDRHLVGLRVQTNQRQSQWFGKRVGVVKTLTAPQGYFLNAIEKLQTSANELGVRLCPITDHPTRSGLSIDIVAHEKSKRVGEPDGSDGTQTEFVAIHDHVRALVVKSGARGEGITDLHMLSSEMFGRHLAKREEPLPTREHLFFLRHGEYVTAVEVHAQTNVTAMRFHTNLTKSPWYGTRSSSDKGGIESMETPHCFRVPEKNLHICGFHGTFGKRSLGSLGVYYSAIPKTAAVEFDQATALIALKRKTVP